jgi:hypothetical protein
LERLRVLTETEARTLAASGSYERLGEAPWPADVSLEDEDGLRVSVELATIDAVAAVRTDAFGGAALERARRAAGRCAHLLVLHHRFPEPEWERSMRPWRPWLVPKARPAPRVRPAR